MLFSQAVLLAIGGLSSCVAHPVQAQAPYSVEEAASIARTLVARESLAQFNTIQQSGSFKDIPVSFVEYYSDCFKDGNPFLLTIDMSTDYQNVLNGSPMSLSVKVGDHQVKDGADPHYPGGIVSSTMGSPRVMLTGSLVNASELYTQSELFGIGKCFVKRHHDSLMWLPGSPVHTSHWSQFKVEGVYFIGGFGDRAYIGEVPVEEYQNAELLDDYEFDETLKQIHHLYKSQYHNFDAVKCDEKKSRFSNIVSSISSWISLV